MNGSVDHGQGPIGIETNMIKETDRQTRLKDVRQLFKEFSQ